MLIVFLWILVHSVSFIKVDLSSFIAWPRPCYTKKSWIVLCQIIKFNFPSNNSISNHCMLSVIALIPLLGNQRFHKQNYTLTKDCENTTKIIILQLILNCVITLQTWVPHSMVTKSDNTFIQRHFSLNKVTLFHNLSSHKLSSHVYRLN